MAAGADARVGIALESTYGTRVAPAKFLPLIAEDLGFIYNRYRSPAIGTGLWGAPSAITSKVGGGSLSGEVTTTGLSYLLNGLHNNTVTPVQQAATTAYLHTHTLSSPPSKSFSIQVQTPPVTSATLIPHDMLGVMFAGITFSWTPDGVLTFEIPVVYQDLDISQTNATYVAPTAYNLFGFKLGSVTIGGAAETNIIGDGSLTISYPLRDDGFYMGGGGKIAKPVLTEKPTASGRFVADFENNTNISRVINETSADVVVRFEGATIASTYKYAIEITLPDCVFTTGRPTVSGPGLVQQEVTFEAASGTADPPVITYMTTDTTI